MVVSLFIFSVEVESLCFVLVFSSRLVMVFVVNGLCWVMLSVFWVELLIDLFVFGIWFLRNCFSSFLVLNICVFCFVF